MIGTTTMNAATIVSQQNNLPPDRGIQVLFPGSGTFENLVQMHAGGVLSAEVNEELQRCVIVVNNSGRNISAVTVRWVIHQPDGRTNVRNVRLHGLNRRDLWNRVLPVGEARLFSLQGELMVAFQSSTLSKVDPALLERGNFEMARAGKVTVTADAAVFEDGTLVGRDESNTLDYLTTTIRARRDLHAAFGQQALRGQAAVLDILSQTAQRGQGLHPRENPYEWAQMEAARDLSAGLRHFGLERMLKELNMFQEWLATIQLRKE